MSKPSNSPASPIRSLQTLALLDATDRRLERAAANLAETVRLQELAAERGYYTRPVPQPRAA